MKLLSLFLGCMLMTPCIGSESAVTYTYDHQAVKDCLFFSYQQAIQATREQGKPYLFVILNQDPEHPSVFPDLLEQAEQWAALQSNVLLLCPTGINLLIYPPRPDPMIAEIQTFKDAFPESDFPSSGSWVVTINTCYTEEFVECVWPLDSYLDEKAR